MTYRAPVRDIRLALDNAGLKDLMAEGFAGLDDDTVTAILEAAGSFADNELAPLNRGGDLNPARLVDGKVVLPPGFVEALQAFAQAGWTSLAADPEHGGQGLPKAVELAVAEMVHGANMALGLCPMLSLGAAEALALNGSDRQKSVVLPKLVSGEWTGAMDLTEPQAGSDLAAITTRAEPDGKGGYRLTGQKIFITYGDHEAAQNICHLVLARVPGAPPGVKGISLFLASKYKLNPDGTLGERNAVQTVSLEHKLGIHGSPTCVIQYEGAEAELVGEENRGLAYMFVMMNAARLQVGMEGVGIAERALQGALAYAVDRRQGRAAWSADYPARLYDHPEVRRSLMLSKAKVEAARAICLTAGVLSDRAHAAADEGRRKAAAARRDLLIPIAKAWSTDLGVEVASAGVQIHGGMGFIEETGAAQHYRDARIAPIYEGTNAIQSLDLVGRKVAGDGGAAMGAVIEEAAAFAQGLSGSLAEVGARLSEGAQALRAATDWILANQGPGSLTSATAYLQLAGDVIGGWMLARQALLAGDGDDWARSKSAMARLYAGRVLSLTPALAQAVANPAIDDLEQTSAEALAG
jgi:alkylation response protein AidB-like acyl-CoA dehydrogenase